MTELRGSGGLYFVAVFEDDLLGIVNIIIIRHTDSQTHRQTHRDTDTDIDTDSDIQKFY